MQNKNTGSFCEYKIKLKNKYKNIYFLDFYPEKNFEEFKQSFILPINYAEFSVSASHILIGTIDKIKIYKYDDNMVLKLKWHQEYQFINFLMRKFNKPARILMYKIILAIYEQNIFNNTKIYTFKNFSEKDNIESDTISYCKCIQDVVDHLKIAQVSKVDYLLDKVIISYVSGEKIVYDKYLKIVTDQNMQPKNDIIINKNGIIVLNEGNIIYEKKIKGILQYERTSSSIFVSAADKIFVVNF